MNLTKAELAALEYIGRHRKTKARVGTGKPISSRMFNQLQRKRLVMWLDAKQTCAMLTANGERVWTKLHPTSKYRIS